MIPVRADFLPFALPDTDESEIDEVVAVIRSGWVTSGPKVRQFEDEFAALVGAKYAVAVNSGTAAMHLALDAVRLRAGEEVITTTLTFAATAEVVRYFDAKPVFVDVEPCYLNIDPSQIERAITPHTRAIIPVHLAGQAADMKAVLQVASQYGLYVIEDAAHALPTKYCDRMVGNLGDLTCFSFYATKPLSTGEGGMICTDDETWAERCRMMSLHGISKDAWNRYTSEGSWFYEIVAPGYKYNMTDVAAAMGIAQLRKQASMQARRAEIAGRYSAVFSALPELQTPADSLPGGQHAWHLYILRLNLDRLTIDRAQFIAQLKEMNIGASVHFIPLHLHPYYRQMYNYQPNDYPVAYSEYQRLVSLPIYSRMTDQDVQDVIEAVCQVVQQHQR